MYEILAKGKEMNIKYRLKFGDILGNIAEITELSKLLDDSIKHKISGDYPAMNEFTIAILNKKITRLNRKYTKLLEDFFYEISRQ